MFKILSISLFIAAFSVVFAETESTKLKIDGSVRYRSETWNGMNARNYGDDSSNAIGSLLDNILYQ